MIRRSNNRMSTGSMMNCSIRPSTRSSTDPSTRPSIGPSIGPSTSPIISRPRREMQSSCSCLPPRNRLAARPRWYRRRRMHRWLWWRHLRRLHLGWLLQPRRRWLSRLCSVPQPIPLSILTIPAPRL